MVMARWLWPEEQRAEHERAKKIALKWRTRNMNWLECAADRFIRYVRDNPKKHRIPIGGDQNPTYWRWFVWPRNRFLNAYLHNFLRDDEEDLHDHRMLNISIVLQGPGYEEDVFLAKPIPGLPLPRIGRRRVCRYIPRIRFPSTPHRVVLYKNDGLPIPIWSLFIGFPHWRDWGFWCGGPHGLIARWVPWQEYIGNVSPTDPRYGQVGKGCGE